MALYFTLAHILAFVSKLLIFVFSNDKMIDDMFITSGPAGTYVH